MQKNIKYLKNKFNQESLRLRHWELQNIVEKN